MIFSANVHLTTLDWSVKLDSVCRLINNIPVICLHCLGCFFTYTVQDPILSISSSIPVLGEDYEATCTLTVDSEISLEEMSSAVTIQWLGPDGMWSIGRVLN